MPTPKPKKFICYISGVKAEGAGEDRIRCAFSSISLAFHNYHLGHICAAILALIVIISIFGKIKENYRWFILNQAVWDLAISYDFISNNGMAHFFEAFTGTDYTPDFSNPEPSFFTSEFFMHLDNVKLDLIHSHTYSALLLLCFTRFLCLFFMRFYEKLTKKRRIFLLIFIFNFVLIIPHLKEFIDWWAYTRIKYFETQCFAEAGKNQKKINKCASIVYIENTYLKSDFLSQVLDVIYRILLSMALFKPVFCLLFSILATFLIVLRIGKQAKFQLQHNRRQFINSFRVAIVMFIQTILYIAVFLVELTNFLQSLSPLGIYVLFGNTYHSDIAVCLPDTLCVNVISIPSWIYGSMGLADYPILQAIVQIRIFLESVTVLAVLTGYREAIINFFKMIFRKPWENYIRRKSRPFPPHSSVTSLFTTRT